jgi:hypothetical protein
MSFLEDFIESIEALPQDIKHNFAQMRTLDLRTQSKFVRVQGEKYVIFLLLKKKKKSQQQQPNVLAVAVREIHIFLKNPFYFERHSLLQG